MGIDRVLRVGTRGSALALWQTNWVIAKLSDVFPEIRIEKVIIKTSGDLASEGTERLQLDKGLFVKEIEEALLRNEIDLAVHSLKDLPTRLPVGLCIGAVPERADPRDALVSAGRSLSELPPGAIVGTTSVRRRAQLANFRSDLGFLDLRGNLDTRLRKLDEGRFDAIVVACAGLDRMGWAGRIIERISLAVCVPAAGQGALALEVRQDDTEVLEIVRQIEDPTARLAVEAERCMLDALGGGCRVPIGACGFVENGRLRLVGVVSSPDGSVLVRRDISDEPKNARVIGRKLAGMLLEAGASQLLC